MIKHMHTPRAGDRTQQSVDLWLIDIGKRRIITEIGDLYSQPEGSTALEG